GQRRGRCLTAGGWTPGPGAFVCGRSYLLQACRLVARPFIPLAVLRHISAVLIADQYLIAPAILRTTERGAKRVLLAPILLTRPGTTTARFFSRPSIPAVTTSGASIAVRSNRLFPPNPATLPNSVRVGPGHRQLTFTLCGFNSS